jgi:hypothetical protein
MRFLLPVWDGAEQQCLRLTQKLHEFLNTRSLSKQVVISSVGSFRQLTIPLSKLPVKAHQLHVVQLVKY